jgi:hypothetical protein
MLIYVNMIFGVSELMFMYPKPVPIHYPSLGINAVYYWLTVEITAFVAIVASNIIFLMCRTCFHHKVQIDKVAERKQLPNVDTITAIESVA